MKPRVEEVTMSFSRMYLPDRPVNTWYGTAHARVYRCHGSASARANVTRLVPPTSSIFVIFQYMGGYCRLSAVSYYWRLPDDIHGGHPIWKVVRGFTLPKWKFLFQHIYFVRPATWNSHWRPRLLRIRQRHVTRVGRSHWRRASRAPATSQTPRLQRRWVRLWVQRHVRGWSVPFWTQSKWNRCTNLSRRVTVVYANG